MYVYIYIYIYIYAYDAIAKIRFQLGKLLQTLVSEDEEHSPLATPLIINDMAVEKILLSTLAL